MKKMFDRKTNNDKAVKKSLKDKKTFTLDEILDSIPEGYRHPEDLQNFLQSEPQGRELI